MGRETTELPPYTDYNANQRSLRPGKCSESTARSIKRHIEKLIVARASNETVELHTAKWLAGIGSLLHNKLLRIGLVEPRKNDAGSERFSKVNRTPPEAP